MKSHRGDGPRGDNRPPAASSKSLSDPHIENCLRQLDVARPRRLVEGEEHVASVTRRIWISMVTIVR